MVLRWTYFDGVAMETTKLSSKGQVIIPKAVRNAHRWGPGQEFQVIDTPDGVLLRPNRSFPESDLDQVAGCLKYDGLPKTLDEMEQAIVQGFEASQNGRG